MSLSPHVPELVLLETLTVVRTRGSMGAAAAELGVSQQAVSRRVRVAEQLLGVEVFRRGAGGVRPTAAGDQVLDWAAQVVDAAAALDRGVAELRGDPRARLAVAVSNTVAEALFPRWAAELRARVPEARISARPGNSDEVVEAVRAGTVVLGFVESPEVPDGLATLDVARDELVVVVPPGHRWTRRGARGVSLAELGAERLATREAGSGTRATFERALTAAGVEVSAPYLEAGSTSAIRSTVLAAEVPAVLSSLVVAADLEQGRLVRVPTPGVRWERVLRAVWQPRRRPTGLAAELLRIAAGEATGQVTRATAGQASVQPPDQAPE